MLHMIYQNSMNTLGGGFPRGIYDFRFPLQFFQNIRFPPIFLIDIRSESVPIFFLYKSCFVFNVKHQNVDDE